MNLPTVFDLCTPRDDVLDRTITDSDFAANLEGASWGCDPGLSRPKSVLRDKRLFALAGPAATEVTKETLKPLRGGQPRQGQGRR